MSQKPKLRILRGTTKQDQASVLRFDVELTELPIDINPEGLGAEIRAAIAGVVHDHLGDHADYLEVRLPKETFFLHRQNMRFAQDTPEGRRDKPGSEQANPA
ncbi:hypothetical protein U8335_20325 [Roseiconus lacunae]|uniref:hypothetical protein n=1 Tax=Roseiconus lacunae TaxID=2605694 RepID=UPI00308F4262|nr:hypothetical protein U8335_20325 [Stieleria sp. HD01]